MCCGSHEGIGDVLGTNLFRCTLSSNDNEDARSPLDGTVVEVEKILAWQHGTLREEIRILKPTHVVFLTGPRYDIVLQNEFEGLELLAVDERPCRPFARALHKDLPGYAIRTYHPSYLRRSGRWSWIEKIGTEIR
jgi:hypothetical protein